MCEVSHAHHIHMKLNVSIKIKSPLSCLHANQVREIKYYIVFPSLHLNKHDIRMNNTHFEHLWLCLDRCCAGSMISIVSHCRIWLFFSFSCVGKFMMIYDYSVHELMSRRSFQDKCINVFNLSKTAWYQWNTGLLFQKPDACKMIFITFVSWLDYWSLYYHNWLCVKLCRNDWRWYLISKLFGLMQNLKSVWKLEC